MLSQQDQGAVSSASGSPSFLRTASPPARKARTGEEIRRKFRSLFKACEEVIPGIHERRRRQPEINPINFTPLYCANNPKPSTSWLYASLTMAGAKKLLPWCVFRWWCQLPSRENATDKGFHSPCFDAWIISEELPLQRQWQQWLQTTPTPETEFKSLYKQVYRRLLASVVSGKEGESRPPRTNL